MSLSSNLLVAVLAIPVGCSNSEKNRAVQVQSTTSQADALRSSLAAAERSNRPDKGDWRDQAMAMGAAPVAAGPPRSVFPDPLATTPAPTGATAPAAAERLVGQRPGNASSRLQAPTAAFLLEESSVLGLTLEQVSRLTVLKEKSATANSATQRKIDQAEQDLWVLTFDVAPDVGKVDVTIRSIALLAAEQRTESMRAVSEATGVLSGAQRKAAFTRKALAPGRKEGM